MRRALMSMILVMLLLFSAALADGLDLVLLSYDAPVRTLNAEEVATQQARQIIPVDLWLDGTANMGGVNSITGSIYAQGAEDSYCTGGFHYLKATGGSGELHGWYLDILTVLPTLLGDKQSTWRVLRYGDESWAEDSLAAAGYAGESTPAVRRDLMTYAVDADAQVFRDMVTPSAAEGFYGTGVASVARIDSLAALENEPLRDSLREVQAKVLSGAAQGNAANLIDRGAGESHLLQALDSLDMTRLNILTLDTWSLGDPAVEDMDSLIDPYRQALLDRDVFGTPGMSAVFFALKLDYIGSVTSYASLEPTEALHWGRFAQTNGRYTEAAMPRCMLVLLLGREGEVTRVADSLEQYLKSADVLRETRGFQSGDGPVTLVNYYYGGERYERTSFGFDCVRSDVIPPRTETLTEADASFTLALDGVAADTAEVTVHPQSDGSYGDTTVTASLRLGEDTLALGLTDALLTGNAQVTQIGSLMQTAVEANQPDTLAALLADENVQVIPQRDRLYVFSQKTLDGLSVSLSLTGDMLTFTLTIPGESLSPGYASLDLSAVVGETSLTAPAVFPWLADTGEDGAADAGKWDVETGERMPTGWLEMPAAVAAASGENRRQLISGLHHAWCTGNQTTTLGRVPDVPPVFRLLNAMRVTQAFQWAAVSGQRQLADVRLTLFVDDQ